MSLAARIPAERLALIAALTTVVLWASAFVGIRAASVDLTAGPARARPARSSARSRSASSSRPGASCARRAATSLLIVASGLLWFAFYNVALNEAERNVDAGTASMLTNMGPILVAVFAGLFLGEGFPPRLMAGIGVAFVGAIVIAFASTSAPVPGGNATLGIVLCLAAAVGVRGRRHAPEAGGPRRARGPGDLDGVPHRRDRLPAVPPGARRGRVRRRSPRASPGWSTSACSRPRSGSRPGRMRSSRTTAGRLGSTTYLVPPIVIVMSLVVLGEVPPLLVDRGRRPVHRRGHRREVARLAPVAACDARGGLSRPRNPPRNGPLVTRTGSDRPSRHRLPGGDHRP